MANRTPADKVAAWERAAAYLQEIIDTSDVGQVYDRWEGEAYEQMANRTPADKVAASERKAAYLQEISDTSKTTDVGQVYDRWEGEAYEQDMADLEYRGPAILAAKVRYWHPDNPDIRVLDVGCGTGLVAQELKKLGYTNIDGVDASGSFLKLAEERGLYRKTLLAFVGGDPLPIPDDSYDAVIGTGITTIGHLPPNAITDMHRLIKPGGHLMIVANYEKWQTMEYLHSDMQGQLDQLVGEGKWRRVEHSIMDQYGHYGLTDDSWTPGLFFAYQKTQQK